MSNSIDLKARQIIMAAWLYYEKNISVISDAEFDALCLEVVADLEWFEAMGESDIDPVRVVQLGSADSLRASGFHIKVTQMAVSGACAWYTAKRKHSKPILPEDQPSDYQMEPSSGVLMRPIQG